MDGALTEETGSANGETPRVGHVLRHVVAEVGRVSFSGNSELSLDSGGSVSPDKQAWTPTRRTPVLFDGAFCIPAVSVEVRIDQSLAVPARMRLTGEADNGMLFTREFTFPAGRRRRRVAEVEADRATGGVFDLVESIQWFVESQDTGIFVGRHSVTCLPIYFVPRRGGSEPPYDTLLYTVCRALKGLPSGHADALARLWEVFEPLDVPCADGHSRLVFDPAEKAEEGLADLLRRRSGSRAAWVAFFLACLRLAGACKTDAPYPGPDGAWPWTVDACSLKVRLLEAKCRHRQREGAAG